MAVEIDIPQDHVFDLILNVVIQLEALFVEELDAVIFKCIMRRRDHDAGAGFHAADKMRDRRRRQNADLDNIAADSQDACADRVFEHIAGHSCIFANQNNRALHVPAEDVCSRFTQMKGQFRSQFCVGHSSHSVCSEQSVHSDFSYSASAVFTVMEIFSGATVTVCSEAAESTLIFAVCSPAVALVTSI